MRLYLYLLLLPACLGLLPSPFPGTGVSAQSADGPAPVAQLYGAWETSYTEANGEPATLSLIITDTHLSMASYYVGSGAFIATLGGKWRADWENLSFTYEYDSAAPGQVGTVNSMPYQLNGDFLIFNGSAFYRRVDDHTGGALAGAWEIVGRKTDGAMQDLSERRDGPRKTMKILSGTRFQWIAFNTETGEFSGTGGGTYTTNSEGLYAEKIEFFSRDDSRVGKQLSFDYVLRDGDWVHKGRSSQGKPIHEVWSPRR